MNGKLEFPFARSKKFITLEFKKTFIYKKIKVVSLKYFSPDLDYLLNRLKNSVIIYYITLLFNSILIFHNLFIYLSRLLNFYPLKN